MHGPAYDSKSVGVDKMAADMAVDFAGTPVCTVSIWMGGVLLTDHCAVPSTDARMSCQRPSPNTPDPEFTGQLIDTLYRGQFCRTRPGTHGHRRRIAER